MAHGGKRPGAGRPAASDPRERVTLYLGESQVIWLEHYTAKWGHTSLSASVRAIIDQQRISEALNNKT